MNDLRVAVTGASGFIGRYVVRELSARGAQLVLLGRDIHKLRTAFNPQFWSFRLVETDYVQGLDAALEDVEAVVHLAGLRYWKDRVLADYIASNVINTTNLFASAVANGINNMVFASTIAAYNPQRNSLPFSEDQCCFPETHYGVSKLLCEKIAAYYNSRFGARTKSLRIGQVVGAGEREGFLLSTMVRQARAKQTLSVWGKGRGARDYVYVKDVAFAVAEALSQPQAWGLFNISRGEPVTHLELAETINQAFGNAGNLAFDPDKVEDTRRFLMSCQRAERELGWRAKWNLADMFADFANELEQSPVLEQRWEGFSERV